jgi:hypothetical protein
MFNVGMTKGLRNTLPCYTAPPMNFYEPNRAEYTQRVAEKPLLVRCEVPYDMNHGQSSVIPEGTWEYRNPMAYQQPSAYRPYFYDSYPTTSYDAELSGHNNAL